MQANPLLEEKYRVQRDMARRAKGNMREYLRLLEEDVRGLFDVNGWVLRYATRPGGKLEDPCESAHASLDVAKPAPKVLAVAEERAEYGTRKRKRT